MTKKEIQELMNIVRQSRKLATKLGLELLDLWVKLYAMKQKAKEDIKGG